MPRAADLARVPAARQPRRALLACALGVLALTIAACGDREFDSAERANTPEAWDAYLRMHPDGTHAPEARAHLAALVEDREWQRAHGADTPDAYQRFLRAYPQGSHAHEALVALAHLNLAQGAVEPAPVVMPPAPTVPARAEPAPAAAPAVAAGYRVQLGAFSEGRAAAARAWATLAARNPELAPYPPLIEAAPGRAGREVHRLQVGGLDAHAAEALCAALAARHDPCVVVPPAHPAPRPAR